jgi:hypothetical protein
LQLCGRDRELVKARRATMCDEPFLSPPTVRALMRAYLADPKSAPEFRSPRA